MMSIEELMLIESTEELVAAILAYLPPRFKVVRFVEDGFYCIEVKSEDGVLLTSFSGPDERIQIFNLYGWWLSESKSFHVRNNNWKIRTKEVFNKREGKYSLEGFEIDTEIPSDLQEDEIKKVVDK